MKTMKKYFKVALCFMAFAICSILFAFAPTLTAYAALDTTAALYNAEINAVHMQKEVNVKDNEEFRIPALKNLGGFESKYTICVYDPDGYEHKYVVGGTGNDTTYFDDSKMSETDAYLKVKALNNGEYQIVYIVEDNLGNKYYSNNYKVVVSNVSYTLDFTKADGSKQLVKSTIAVGSTIELPVATVKTATGTVVESANVLVEGTRNNGDIGDCLDEDSGVYKLTPNVKGTYTVTYTYKSGNNIPSKTFTITAVDAEKYTQPTDLKLVSTPTMPTSVQLGQKDVKLPQLTLKNSVASGVEHNITEIRIENENDSNVYQVLTNNDLTFDMTTDAFTFASGEKSYDRMLGNYRVTYKAVDAYNNPFEETFTISGVTITSTPSVYMTYDYEIDGTTHELVTDAEDINKDASTSLKAMYGFDEVRVPAIYGEDNITEYKDLILIRYLVNANSRTTYYVDNLRYNETTKQVETVTKDNTPTGFNYAADAGYNVNKATAFKFTDGGNGSNFAGEYYLEYRVVAKNIKTRENYLYVSGKTEYSFTVTNEATYSYVGAQTTTIDNLTSLKEVNSKDILNVNVTSKDDVDTRLKNQVFYYFLESGSATATFAEDLTNAISNLNNDNTNKLYDENLVKSGSSLYTKYPSIQMAEFKSANSFDVDVSKKLDGSKKIVIVAVSLRDDGKVVVDQKTLNIKDTSEKDAPKAEIVTADVSSLFSGTTYVTKEFDMGDEITLPTVRFNETGVSTDSTLALNIMYYIDTPINEQGIISYKYPTVAPLIENNTIKGAKITANDHGLYHVIYSAMDDAGNTSVVYFSFKVKDTSPLNLTVEAKGENITEKISEDGLVVTATAGTTIAFNPTLRSNDARNNYTEDATFNITKVEYVGDGCNYASSGDLYSYTFNGVGTYKITFKGSYDGRYDEKTITINVTKPELKWLGDFDSIPEVAKSNQEVYLPSIAASLNAVVEVKVTAPGGTEIKATKVVNGDHTEWMFKTLDNSKGTYKVQYIARTTNDTLESKQFEIKVGDNVKPEFSMNHEEDLKQDIVYDGNQIEYNVNVDRSNKKVIITAKKNGETIYSYDLGLVISDQDDTNTTVQNSSSLWSESKFKVEFTTENGTIEGTDGNYIIKGTGKYTIKLKVTDSYNNTTEKSISFNVVSHVEAEEKNDNVVGIVLIVISLLVLAGVILFFTFTGKKTGGKKSKKTNTAKKQVSETVETEAKVTEEVAKVEETVTATEVEEVENNKEAEAEIVDEPAEENIVVEDAEEEPKADDAE